MIRYLNTALLGIVLTLPVTAPALLRADDDHPARYEDRAHHDQHEWNDREDRAYRNWSKEQHRDYVQFNRLKREDQDSYWKWRHEHPDDARTREGHEGRDKR